jgi:hypothetical protein
MNIRQKTPGLLATIGLAAFACAPLNAASPTDLATYTFAPGDATKAISTANAPYVTATNWTPSTTLKTDTGFSSLEGDYYIRGTTFLAVTTEEEARTNGSWLAFSITIEEDWTATLGQFSASIRLQSTYNDAPSPRKTTWLLTVATNEDGQYINVGNPIIYEATSVSNSTNPIDQTTSWTVDLTGIPLSITGGTLWFRIYEWDNSGNYNDIFRIDDVHLTGTVNSAAVPEPSTYALLVVGAVAAGGLLFRFRFRRQVA